MGFERVKLNNFRNIEPYEIKWSGGLNLLTGPNGSGKTNILEALNILSGWGPLEKGTKIKNLFKWESNDNKILLTGQKNDVFKDIIQVRISEKYSIRVNDKIISATELRLAQPVLTFLPNDTQIVEGPSFVRRRLLDMLLALLIPPYAKRINEYKRGVKIKGAYLKKGKNTDSVDKALKPLSIWIWKMRKEAVNMIFDCMSKLDELVPEGIELVLKRGGGNFLNEENEDWEKGIAFYRDREKKYLTPLVGPHRDDIEIRFHGKQAEDSLSRGFRRRVSIAMILALSDGVLKKTGNIPTLLLDEVTAELDEKGREILFGSLLDRRAQVFAATAEPFTENFKGAVYKISGGQVEEVY